MRLIAKAYLVFMALSFAVVGTAALADPQAVASRLDLLPQSVKGAAEVRCLYGGGFISWSLIIIGALRYRSVAQGMLMAMGLTMGSIATVRLASGVLDHGRGFDPVAILFEALIPVACWVVYREKSIALQ
jgi:hypothetical protein